MSKKLFFAPLLMLVCSIAVVGLTPDGTANFTVYPGNPVYNKTFAFESNALTCAEFSLQPGFFTGSLQYLDRWCHTQGNVIEYGNTTDLKNWKLGNATIIDIGNNWDSPSVAIKDGVYYLMVQNETDHAVYAFNSTNKVNFTFMCQAIPNIGTENANVMLQYFPETNSFYTMTQRQSGGTWDIYAFNGTTVCNQALIGLIASNAYNPWFYRFNDTLGNVTWVLTISRPNASAFDIEELRGNAITNMTSKGFLLRTPTGQTWDQSHLGDSHIYNTALLVPNIASTYSNKCYLFYGNNDVGLALDTENRACEQIFNITSPGNSSSIIIPSSTGTIDTIIILFLLFALMGALLLWSAKYFTWISAEWMGYIFYFLAACFIIIVLAGFVNII